MVYVSQTRVIDYIMCVCDRHMYTKLILSDIDLDALIHCSLFAWRHTFYFG